MTEHAIADRKPPRRRLVRGCASIVLALSALLIGCVGVRWLAWPDVESLRTENPTTSAFVERYERRSGETISLEWVPWNRIDDDLKYAVIVAEDSEFLDHDGFSTFEMKAAIRQAIEQLGAPRGASTITQQLAKNLWLSPSRNPLRKIEEAILTRQLERHLSKRRILEIYLNVVEFGPGIYGVGPASRHYFGRLPRRLSRRQAAMLAASLPRPASWHPGVHSAGYDRYVETIRDRMERFVGLRERIDRL